MTEGFKQHLPVVIVVFIVGIATGWLAMNGIHDAAASLSVRAFSALLTVVPCAIMLLASFLTVVTARSIGRNLYIVNMVACLAAGIVSMVVASAWMSDPAITSALLANSPEGSTVTPYTDAPLLILRNIAAYVVMPTIGSIAGAWVGSRLHEVSREGSSGKRKKK